MDKILLSLFNRDLAKLKDELNAYPDETKLWHIEKGISNSAGNLTLHLIGNLNHFIGAILGNTGFVRNRDSEFTLKSIPRAELLEGIDKTILILQNTLSSLSPQDFEKAYPLPIADKEVSTAYFMVHLATHLNYHLGQINYHRRLLAA